MISGACWPSRKWKLKCPNGSCGSFSKLIVNWPVTGFGRDLPRELDDDPPFRAAARDHVQRDQRPVRMTGFVNGFSYGCAKYIDPYSGREQQRRLRFRPSPASNLPDSPLPSQSSASPARTAPACTPPSPTPAEGSIVIPSGRRHDRVLQVGLRRAAVELEQSCRCRSSGRTRARSARTPNEWSVRSRSPG